MAENISIRLISAFNAKDLKEVAAEMQEKYTTLHNWASGRRDFPSEMLIKIAKMTNTSIDWLLTGEGEKYLESNRKINLDETFREIVREIVREEIAKENRHLVLAIGKETEKQKDKAA